MESYREREGIALDPTRIVKNSECKATCKLALNSYWRKFGENLLKSTTHAVSTPAGLYELLNGPLLTINTVRVCTEDKLEVVNTPLKDDLLDNGKVNIFIAAFTTCHARLQFYAHLKTLGDRALYFDTDSVIYKWQPGQSEIPLGDYLGEMTNELEGEDFIVDFTSSAPKNYGYITNNGNVCCKVRGFTLYNKRGHEGHSCQSPHQTVWPCFRQVGGESSHFQVLSLWICRVSRGEGCRHTTVSVGVR